MVSGVNVTFKTLVFGLDILCVSSRSRAFVSRVKYTCTEYINGVSTNSYERAASERLVEKSKR